MSGGLAMLWRKNIQVSLRSLSSYFIDVDFSYQNSNIRVTGVYGEPDVSRRRIFWNFFKSNFSLHSPSTPWVCFGDFNEVLLQSEFKGRNMRADWQIHAFREALSHCNLLDMGFSGSWYTWHRLLTYPFTQRARLDRCVGNDALNTLFPHHKIEHLTTISSDHQALFIHLSPKPPTIFRQRRRNPFRFEACWIKAKDCEKSLKRTGIQTWIPSRISFTTAQLVY
ncbi:hypothetical protein DH2020_025567 [Rehmannia glutinosa]|uniref:Endonuclease/exonuclease/phosphatase domain-containing protein n=1 Tax=Rehmannia glutinosa TaxID=99300 RepID=A0ABR0W3L2_REHGL